MDKAEPLLPAAAATHPTVRAESAAGRALIQLTFLLLGAESSITLSTVTLAAAYFKDSLGDGIISALISAHCSALLIVMLLILVALPSTTSLRVTSTLVSCAVAFGVCFNGFMLTSLLADQPVRGALLYPLVAVNGAATGLIQSLSSRLGGDLPTTNKTAVGSLQLVGVGLAQWLPGLVQACLLPYAAQPGKAHGAAGLGATLSLAAATVLCLATLATLQVTLHLFGASVKATADDPGMEPSLKERCKTIGTVCRSPPGRHFVWYERVVLLAPMTVLLFTAEALYTFLIVLSPHLPVATGPTGEMAFWQTYQVTLLLMSANSATSGIQTHSPELTPKSEQLARCWCPTLRAFGRHGSQPHS